MEDDAHAMTVRFAPEMYERLRRLAFERRVPMLAIITEGTVARMDEIEAEQSRAAT